MTHRDKNPDPYRETRKERRIRTTRQGRQDLADTRDLQATHEFAVGRRVAA